MYDETQVQTAEIEEQASHLNETVAKMSNAPSEETPTRATLFATTVK